MKLMWLYDIFNEDDSAPARMITAIKSLGFTSKDIVQATYVAHPGESQLAHVDKEIPFSKKLLLKKISEFNTKDLTLKPFVLFEDSSSFRKIIDRVLSVAKKNNISTIALQTHGKKGFKDFVLGSFAETFVHRSQTSMLILSPVCKPAKKLKKIIFATDLDTGALEAVIQAATIAARADAELCLFHIPQPIYNSQSEDMEIESAKYKKSVHRKLDMLVTASEKLGVKTEFLLDPSWDSAANLILKAAKTAEADLIITNVKRGPVGNLFLGSTTSRLIRTAHTPVYVLRF